jgi:hypothetical protein
MSYTVSKFTDLDLIPALKHVAYITNVAFKALYDLNAQAMGNEGGRGGSHKDEPQSSNPDPQS